MNVHHLFVVVPPVIDIRLSQSEELFLTLGIDLAQHGESSFRATLKMSASLSLQSVIAAFSSKEAFVAK